MLPFAVPHDPFTILFALQLAVVPVFSPVQLQVQGPAPVTDVGVPVVHRFVTGAALRFAPSELPQAPFTSLFALQLAGVPPPLPAQFQVQGPAPLTAVLPASDVHRFVSGAAVRFAPCEVPQAPLYVFVVLQDAVVPVCSPAQVHVHVVSVDVTPLGVPALQKFVIGSAALFVPCDAPHSPFTTLLALQDAGVPAPLPLQLQVQGPAPDTAVLPASDVHRFVVGDKLRFAPCASPHVPLYVFVVLQLAVVPVFSPAQVQVQVVSVDVTPLGVPALQKFAAGSTALFVPCDAPHSPFTSLLALHRPLLLPPCSPVHVQVHGPAPDTTVAVPDVHRFVTGAAARFAPLELPHSPFSVLFALQLAVVPVFSPVQLQVQGPAPDTAVAVPALHRFVPGAALRFAPSELPHSPFTSLFALHAAGVPSPLPLQLHVQGPAPLTAVLPASDTHRFVIGAAVTFAPFDVPHSPLYVLVVLQLAVVPVCSPAHVQVHVVSVDVTPLGVPASQKFAAGSTALFVPLDVPHSPFTSLFALHSGLSAPPFIPLHVHVQGPLPLTRPPTP